MDPIVIAVLFAVGLFLGMLLLLEIGWRIGNRRLRQDPEGARVGTAVIEGAVFALLGLLVAFTFSGAAGRFDSRRQLVVEEANAIGTAYLRLDLVPKNSQAELRELFRQYLDTRLATYRKLPDLEASKQELARTAVLQNEIWTKAVDASRPEGSSATTLLLLPALNQMIDITTTRTMSAQMHPPSIVFALLFLVSLGCALVAGIAMAGSKRRSWFHTVGFAAVIALTVYVILDIEYPRMGLIRIDAVDQVLVELRASMK